jgi:diguanylate cyclase (GGDEF)-like protein
MPSSLSEDSPFRAGVLPETQVLLAGQDLLTGLSSRAGLEAHFRLAAARARRSGARFAVGIAVVGVDPVTPPDEVFGHDLLVVAAAKQLRASLRETDLIARLGETRFAFVAEEVPPSGVATIARRIANALATANDGEAARVGPLVGMTLWESDEHTLPALLRRAEENLSADPSAPALPDAANAESFGGSPPDEVALENSSVMRSMARRGLGWISLLILIALALSAAPEAWRPRWWPVASVAQQGWSSLRAQLPWLPPAAGRRP